MLSGFLTFLLIILGVGLVILILIGVVVMKVLGKGAKLFKGNRHYKRFSSSSGMFHNPRHAGHYGHKHYYKKRSSFFSS